MIMPACGQRCARLWRRWPIGPDVCISSETRRDLAAWLAKWSGKYAKPTGRVEENIDETLTFYRLPRQHHKNLKSIIRGAHRQTAVLLLQSLVEFSYVATRKFGVSVASVRRRVDGWCGGFPVQPAAEPDLAAALDLVSAHNISFWDALLCATSIRTGLSLLMTEDLQDGRSLHGQRHPGRPYSAALKSGDA
jgi:predicted nucleic acid-binding protein